MTDPLREKLRTLAGEIRACESQYQWIALRIATILDAEGQDETADDEIRAYADQMDRAEGVFYSDDFRQGFRHAIEMYAADSRGARFAVACALDRLPAAPSVSPGEPVEMSPGAFVDKWTGKPCPTRGKTLCTIIDPKHRHVVRGGTCDRCGKSLGQTGGRWWCPSCGGAATPAPEGQPEGSERKCRHADSLYGRCADCGMTWEAQAKAFAPAPVPDDEAVKALGHIIWFASGGPWDQYRKAAEAVLAAGYVSPEAHAAAVREARADALAEAEHEIRDAKTLDPTTRAAVCAVLRGRIRRIREAVR